MLGKRLHRNKNLGNVLEVSRYLVISLVMNFLRIPNLHPLSLLHAIQTVLSLAPLALLEVCSDLRNRLNLKDVNTLCKEKPTFWM